MMKAVVRFLLPVAVVASATFSATGIAAADTGPQGWRNCGVQQYGSRGECVSMVQQRLRLPMDGIYGTQTRDAVMSYQARHHLQLVDGKAGPETYTSMFNGAS